MGPKSTPSSAGQRSKSPRRTKKSSAGAPKTGNADEENFLPNVRAKVSGSYGGYGKADLPGDMARPGQSADFAAELENEVLSSAPADASIHPPSELGYEGPTTRSRTGSPVKEPPAPAQRKSASATSARAGRASARTSAKTAGTNMTAIPEDSPLPPKPTKSSAAEVRKRSAAARTQDQDQALSSTAASSDRTANDSANGPANRIGDGRYLTIVKKAFTRVTHPGPWEILLIGGLLVLFWTIVICIAKGNNAQGVAIGYPSLCLSNPLDTLKFYWTMASLSIWSLFNPDGAQVVKILKAYDSRLHTLEQSDHAVQQSIEYITGHIPNWAIRRTATGDIHLTDEFWRAVKDKAEIDTSIATGPKAWTAFYNNNEKAFDRSIQNKVDDRVQWQMEQGDILPRIQITNMLQLHARQLRDLIRTKFDEVHKYPEIREYAMKQAKMTVDATLANSPASYAHLVATASLLFSQTLSLTEVNFASFAVGAYISPGLTSPTYPVHETAWTKFWKNLIQRAPNPPVTALRSWTEGGECWCTAQVKKTDPQAQLSIHLAASVYPKTFALEHVPKKATLYPYAVPKDLELWVDIPDDDSRARIRAALPTGLDITSDKGQKSRRSWWDWLRAIGTAPKDLVVGHDFITLPDTYVRILKSKYLYDPKQFIEVFDITANADFYALNVTVRDVTVRATTNYGSPFTCIYRVRVGGAPGLISEPLEEATSPEPGEVHWTDVDDTPQTGFWN